MLVGRNSVCLPINQELSAGKCLVISATRYAPPVGGGIFHSNVSDRKVYIKHRLSGRKHWGRETTRVAPPTAVVYTSLRPIIRNTALVKLCLYRFYYVLACTTYTGNARKLDILNHSFLVGGCFQCAAGLLGCSATPAADQLRRGVPWREESDVAWWPHLND